MLSFGSILLRMIHWRCFRIRIHKIFLNRHFVPDYVAQNAAKQIWNQFDIILPHEKQNAFSTNRFSLKLKAENYQLMATKI